MKIKKMLLIVLTLAVCFAFAISCAGDPPPAPNQVPEAGDYDIGNLNQTAGSVTAVTVRAKAGKSPGTVAVLYNGSATIPQTAGTYTVTFNVAAAEGWDDASGLSAGTLTVNNQTPVAADFDFGNLTQTVGSTVAVTITPKAGKSGGAVTIYYNGSATRPTTAGNYPVTFDVAAAAGWEAANGLSAGTLTINASNQTPVAADFDFGNLAQSVGSIAPVTITPKAGKSGGAITIYYNGVTTLPTTAGRYSITFNVAAATGWNARTGLSAGTLTITDPTPAPAAELNLDGAQTYTVVRGDTLSRIAARFYGNGNGYYYPIIYLVSDEVEDIDVIEIGMRLTIPNLQVNIDDPVTRARIKNLLIQAAQINEAKGRPEDGAALRRRADSL